MMMKQKNNLIPVAAFNLVVLAVVALLIKFGIIGEYNAGLLSLSAINVIVAIGLNVISGFTGQLALGHAGFMSIGAYAAAFCVMQLKLPFVIAIIIAGFITMLFGIIIGFPTLRLRGDYLAIVTLGFGEIIRVIMINLEGLTGGAAGLKGIPTFHPEISENPWVTFLWTTGFMVLIMVLTTNLIRSSHGRAIISIREDEVASGSMGIGVFRYKMLSFGVSTFIAGIGGGLYAFYMGYLNPTMFDFMKSVNFVVIVVFGGMGSVTGTFFAGYAITFLQEWLRFMKDYRLVFFALLIIVVMIFWPGGIMGNKEISLSKLIKTRNFKKSIHKDSGETKEEI